MRTAARLPARPALNPFQLYALIFCGLFLTHAPLLRLPYFWDEAGYFVPAARDLLLTGDPVPHSTLSNAHPPLLMAYLALWWKLSGSKPAVTRIALLLVAAFGLLEVFRLSRRLAGLQVAAATTLCTALYPVFFAQSSLALADLPAAALTLAGLRLYLEGESKSEERQIGAPAPEAISTGSASARGSGSQGAPVLLAFSLAALTKETAIITPLALFLWEQLPAWTFLAKSRRASRKAAFLAGGRLLLPIVPLAAWFFYHWLRTGYVFGNPDFFRYNVTATLNPLRILPALLLRLWHLLGYMNMVALTAAVGLALTLPPLADHGQARPRIEMRLQGLLGVLVLAHMLVFSVFGGAALARYLLPAMPLVILICVSTLRRRVRAWPAAIAVVCGAFLLALLVNPPYRFAPEDNLAYRDFVLLHRRAAGVLESRYPASQVLTAWPASDELTRPYLGYVSRPLRVVRLENFSAAQLLLAAHSPDYDVALIFSTKYSPPHPLPAPAFWERLNRRFFGYQADLPPEPAAQMLGGRIVFRDQRGGQWAAIVEIERARNAGDSPQRHRDRKIVELSNLRIVELKLQIPRTRRAE